MNYSKLYGKQIIRVCDGSLVGTLCDLSFDSCDYQLKAIHACIPLCGWKKYFPFLFQKDAIEILMKDIISLEGDVILIH